jgi:hypothetical protein
MDFYGYDSAGNNKSIGFDLVDRKNQYANIVSKKNIHNKTHTEFMSIVNKAIDTMKILGYTGVITDNSDVETPDANCFLNNLIYIKNMVNRYPNLIFISQSEIGGHLYYCEIELFIIK